MSYNIILTDSFKKDAKKLVRKYPSLKEELLELSHLLQSDPFIGTNLGNGVFKIRLAVKSKGKGKRSGVRILSFVKIIRKTVYLFTIYSKGAGKDISDQ